MAQTSTWKHTERRIAKALGGKRNGNRGSATADVQGDWYVAEVKHRKRLPPLLHSAMRQAVAAAQPGQLPLVVLHETNKAGDDDYVVVRLSDFVEWYGDVEGEDV